MLGTNDAKDAIDGGPKNWGCGVGANVTVENCQYAQDYLSFIDVVQKLGPGGAAPVIYVMVPAPLMAHGAIGANQVRRGALRPHLMGWRISTPLTPPHAHTPL